MARNFKLYGCAHDSSGNLDVTLSIGGSEVYNGTLTARTDTHSAEESLPVDELFSFDLADDVSGDTAWSVTVTSPSGDGSLNIGKLESNGTGKPNMIIPLSYFMEKLEANGLDLTIPFTAEQQTYIDTTLGDKLPADVRARLQAGTSVVADDGTAVMLANETDGEDNTHYEEVVKTYSNGQLDGEAYDLSAPGVWPMVADGQTLTMTVNMTIPVFAYDPPIAE